MYKWAILNRILYIKYVALAIDPFLGLAIDGPARVLSRPRRRRPFWVPQPRRRRRTPSVLRLVKLAESNDSSAIELIWLQFDSHSPRRNNDKSYMIGLFHTNTVY